MGPAALSGCSGAEPSGLSGSGAGEPLAQRAFDEGIRPVVLALRLQDPGMRGPQDPEGEPRERGAGQGDRLAS